MLNPEFQTHLLNDEGIKKAVHIGNVFDARPQSVIEFRNVHDGKCTVAWVTLDAQTKRQVVQCR